MPNSLSEGKCFDSIVVVALQEKRKTTSIAGAPALRVHFVCPSDAGAAFAACIPDSQCCPLAENAENGEKKSQLPSTGTRGSCFSLAAVITVRMGRADCVERGWILPC